MPFSFADRPRKYVALREFLSFLSPSFKDSHLLPHFKFLVGILYLTDYLASSQNLTTQNDITTFFANHYLKDIVGLKQLKSVSYYAGLLNRTVKTSFWSDLLKSTHDSDQFLVSLDDYIHDASLEDSVIPSTHFPSPPPEFEHLVLNWSNFLDDSTDNNALFPNSCPDPSIYDEIKDIGISVVPNFLSADSLQILKRHISLLADLEKKADCAYIYGPNNRSQRIYNLINKDPVVADLVTCNYIRQLNETLFDRDTYHQTFGISSVAAHIVGPGSSAQPWHLDSVLPDPLPPYMVRFVCVITLDNFTFDNGATEYISGSHLYLRRPQASDRHILSAPCKAVAPAGSLIAWDGSLWHRSGENNTDKSRSCLILSFASSIFREICGEEDYLTVIPKDRILSMTPLLQSLIGYNRGIKSGSDFIPPPLG